MSTVFVMGAGATGRFRRPSPDDAGPLDGVHRAFGVPARTIGGETDCLRKRTRDQEPAPAA